MNGRCLRMKKNESTPTPGYMSSLGIHAAFIVAIIVSVSYVLVFISVFTFHPYFRLLLYFGCLYIRGSRG